ncbi:uncharacterized protein [Periplaneta americana]
MVELAARAPDIPTYEFNKPSGKISYKDISKNEDGFARKRVKNDTKWLIKFLYDRGVNFEKQRRYLDKNVAEHFGNLLSRYRIPFKPWTLRNMGPEVVTLPRVASAFAADTCWMLYKDVIKPLVPYNMLLDENESVPMCLFGTEMPALIPRDEMNYSYAPKLVDLALWVAWQFDDIINKKKTKTKIDKMKYYLQVARNNQVFTDAARHSFLKEVKILTETGELQPEVLRVCEKAGEAWARYIENPDPDRTRDPFEEIMQAIFDVDLLAPGTGVEAKDPVAEEA